MRPGTKFTPIADAVSRVGAALNLIGVVVDTGMPRKTKGTDFSCSVKIIDESQPSGFFLIFFANPVDRLPSPSHGDIIIVSNFKIKLRDRGDVYAMFLKKYSTFAILKGISDELVPYPVSAMSRYEPSGKDEKQITELRKWHHGDKLKVLLEPLYLREIEKGKSCILLCKILHVVQVKKDEWMLFVWDGTDTPKASVDVKLEDEMENPLPLEVESSPLSREILHTFPPVGSVLRMTVDKGHGKLDIELLRPNKWVKFTNIKCEASAALWHAVSTPASELTYFPEDDYSVMQRQSIYKKRIESKIGRWPLTCFPAVRITETDHWDVPFVTLMDVLTHPEVAGRFRCVVRVVAVSPWGREYLFSPSNFNGMRWTLEDPTARLRACIFPEDWCKFFGNCRSPEVLLKKLNVLLGVESNSKVKNVSRNPPWIECCLRSYGNKKNDVWGSRRYLIFGTECVV